MGQGLKHIVIDIIPQSQQRYETVGDYFFKDDGLHIVCSDLGDDYLTHLITLHELSEVLQILKNGIKIEDIDKFDMEWKPHDGINESGFDPKAPYNKEHIVADFIENFQCKEMGYTWEEYENKIEGLFNDNNNSN